MEKVSGIYKIINKISGKYYVGSSSEVERRWYNHKIELANNRHSNSHLQRSWNKYGPEAFDFVIVEENIPEQELLTYEQKHLSKAAEEKSMCFNMSFIAGRVEMTDAVRKKLSKSHSGKNNVNYGKPRPEIMELLRKHNLGKCHTQEHKQKISNSLKGEKNRFYGKHHSNLTKQKLCAAHKGKPNLLVRDPSIFNFYNKITGETFTGTKYDLKHKHNVCHVSDLVSGKRSISNGWVIILQEMSVAVG